MIKIDCFNSIINLFRMLLMEFIFVLGLSDLLSNSNELYDSFGFLFLIIF